MNLQPPVDADTPMRRQLLQRMSRQPTARSALLVLALLVLVALLGPFLVPQNPYDLSALNVMDNRQPPGASSMTGLTFWLGSDAQGRDMLSAIVYGLRTSLFVRWWRCPLVSQWAWRRRSSGASSMRR